MGNSPGDEALKKARQRHGWSFSKTSRRRPEAVTREESDIRWALLYEKDPEKKQELIKKLENLLQGG